MQKKFQIIAIFSLFTQLYALPFDENFQIGLGFDQNSAKIKPSSFIDFEIKTDLYEKNIEKKIVKIDNFEHLLDEIGMEKTFSIFKSKKIRDLLSNSKINNYTQTYLIYKRVTNFKNSLQDAKIGKKYGDSYVDSIEIGDEFIALVHIKTNSQNEYKKIDKILDKKVLNFENANELSKRFEEISKTHIVSFKNSSSQNIKELLEDAKTINRELPYKVNLKSYKDTKIIKQIPVIKEYLKALQVQNNLKYIKRNSKQFNNNKKTFINETRELSKIVVDIEKNSSHLTKKLKKLIETIKYPKQYLAYIDDKNLKLPLLQLQTQKIEKMYPKILDKIEFTLHYDFKLRVKNSGKVIILDWTKTIKEGEKEIQKDTNSKILLDSYINYKNLKATNIVGNSYGSLTFKTTFNSYEKSKKVKGGGIIKSAICGYKLTLTQELKMQCEDIELKELKIKFKHDD